MNLNKKCGFSLAELMVALLIISIISVLITSLFIYGYESFNVYARYTGQQEKINQAIRVLGKDIQESKSITCAGLDTNRLEYIECEIPLASGTEVIRRWALTGSALQCDGTNSVEAIDTSASTISLIQSSNKLTVSILPLPTNSGKYQGNNIKNPITAEFSVNYKEIIIP